MVLTFQVSTAEAVDSARELALKESLLVSSALQNELLLSFLLVITIASPISLLCDL